MHVFQRRQSSVWCIGLTFASLVPTITNIITWMKILYSQWLPEVKGSTRSLMQLPSVSAYLWVSLLSRLSSVAEKDALLGWDHVTDLAISNIPFLCFENVLGCFCSMLWLICTEKHYWSVMELLIFVLLFLEIMMSSCTSFVIFGLSDLFYGAEPASAFILFKNIPDCWISHS